MSRGTSICPEASGASVSPEAGLPAQRRPFFRTIFGVRLCWQLEEPEGPERPRGHGSFEAGPSRGRRLAGRASVLALVRGHRLGT